MLAEYIVFCNFLCPRSFPEDLRMSRNRGLVLRLPVSVSFLSVIGGLKQRTLSGRKIGGCLRPILLVVQSLKIRCRAVLLVRKYPIHWCDPTRKIDNTPQTLSLCL